LEKIQRKRPVRKHNFPYKVGNGRGNKGMTFIEKQNLKILSKHKWPRESIILEKKLNDIIIFFSNQNQEKTLKKI